MTRRLTLEIELNCRREHTVAKSRSDKQESVRNRLAIFCIGTSQTKRIQSEIVWPLSALGTVTCVRNQSEIVWPFFCAGYWFSRYLLIFFAAIREHFLLGCVAVHTISLGSLSSAFFIVLDAPPSSIRICTAPLSSGLGFGTQATHLNSSLLTILCCVMKCCHPITVNGIYFCLLFDENLRMAIVSTAQNGDRDAL